MAPTAIVAAIGVFAVVAVATDEAVLGFVSSYSVVGYIAWKSGDPIATGLFVTLTLIAALGMAGSGVGVMTGGQNG